MSPLDRNWWVAGTAPASRNRPAAASTSRATKAVSSALLTSVKDDKDKTAVYLSECRSLGIEVVVPDVNRSYSDFAPRVDEAEKPGILFGLSAVRNVGENLVEREGITALGMVPTVARMLLPIIERAPRRCRTLRRLIVTGEAFPVELKRRLIELLPASRSIGLCNKMALRGLNA